MFNSIKLTLYTQEDCYYCYELKKKLVEWGYDFREINISHDLFAKDFLKIKDIEQFLSYIGTILI